MFESMTSYQVSYLYFSFLKTFQTQMKQDKFVEFISPPNGGLF